jgi:hypothetical protein
LKIPSLCQMAASRPIMKPASRPPPGSLIKKEC